MLHFKRTFVYASSECWTTYCKGSRTRHPHMPLDVLIILSQRQQENSKCRRRLSLNSPPLPKDRCSTKNSTVITPPQEFLQPERTDSSQEKRLEAHTTPIQTSSPTASHLSPCFLKIIYSALLSFLSRCNLSLNSKSSFLSYSFYSSVFPMCTRGIHFSLVYLSFIKGASSQNSEA